MILTFFADPPKFAFTIPLIDYPIAWYGVFFAAGFFLALRLFVFLCDYRPFSDLTGEDIGSCITNYMMLGVILGARLFHLFFYESWLWVYEDPLRLFRFWEGGLASHGGIVCALVACAVFSKKKNLPFLALSDRIFPCGMVLGSLIRLGNFMNQEILGVQTDLPWGVIFSSPSSMVSFGLYPRHPVQIYESFFYIFLALVGIYMLRRCAPRGRVSSVLGFLLFFGRFLVEFLKEEQSLYTQQMSINMGQALSIPLMAIALVALAYTYRQPLKIQK